MTEECLGGADKSEQSKVWSIWFTAAAAADTADSVKQIIIKDEEDKNKSLSKMTRITT